VRTTNRLPFILGSADTSPHLATGRRYLEALKIHGRTPQETVSISSAGRPSRGLLW
jgi:hypothetical protein